MTSITLIRTSVISVPGNCQLLLLVYNCHVCSQYKFTGKCSFEPVRIKKQRARKQKFRFVFQFLKNFWIWLLTIIEAYCFPLS
jgi:hypothetical protein